MYKGPLEIFHASRGFIFRGNVESEELQTKLFIVKHFTFTGTALSRCRFHGDMRWDSSFCSVLWSRPQHRHSSIWCPRRHHSVHKYIPERLSLLWYMQGCPPSSNSIIYLTVFSWEMLANSKERWVVYQGTRHPCSLDCRQPAQLALKFQKSGCGGRSEVRLKLFSYFLSLLLPALPPDFRNNPSRS